MLKKTIKFVDYNGEERIEDFYFNISKAEMIEMEVAEKGGLSKLLERIIQTRDNATLFAIFKEIILKAYGEKSADGRQFIKNQQIRDSFEQSEAYSNLLMEFLTGGSKVVADFFKAIIPSDISKELNDDNIKKIIDGEMNYDQLISNSTE